VAYSQRRRSLVESWRRNQYGVKVAYQIRRKRWMSHTQHFCVDEFHALKLVSWVEARGELEDRNEKVNNFAFPKT
jgi:hypothetical protein